MQKAHLALQAYAQKHSIPLDALRTLGKLTITVEDSIRVHIHPFQNNELMFNARICPLPEDSVEMEVLLDHVLNLTYATAKDTKTFVCIMPDQNDLALQLKLPASTSLQDFEKAFEYFIQHLNLWRKYTK